MSEGESGRRIVDGRFELEARLGGGGMGTVWRARDLLLHPRRIRRVVIASSAAATVLAVGLIWGLLPSTGKADAAASQGGGTAAVGDTTGGHTSGQPATSSTPDTSAQVKSLLTPTGIRTAIKAIEEETGRDTFGDFTVYPEYVVADVMVKGSRTRYDHYTYRLNGGVEKGIISGSLLTGEQPFTLKDFDWDAVPSLLAQATKKLHVDKPTSRYLAVNAPSTLWNTPVNMAVYLSNDYSETGYLQADTHGKITKVMPFDRSPS